MTDLIKKISNPNKLKQRFAKDYNLPINVFREDLWNYYMGLYDNFPTKQWNYLIEKINNDYDGNVEKWLDYCAQVRDTAILGTMETEEYKKFNSMDLKIFDVKPTVPTVNCYTEATDGKRFISIDLRKANFQVMQYMDVLNDNTYEDFIKRCGGDDYIINSKHLRQVIFGKMNPSRQIKIERWMANQVSFIANGRLKDLGFELFSLNIDELIYKDNNELPIERKIIENKCFQIFFLSLFDIEVEYIEIKRLPIVSSNGNSIDAYVRKNLITGEEKLKKASTTFYPQIYKLWKGLEIEDNDLYFYAENQLAKFCEPLKLEKK